MTGRSGISLRPQLLPNGNLFLDLTSQRESHHRVSHGVRVSFCGQADGHLIRGRVISPARPDLGGRFVQATSVAMFAAPARTLPPSAA